jgi:uncharacterized repeat protein (TIGR02543 family)
VNTDRIFQIGALSKSTLFDSESEYTVQSTSNYLGIGDEKMGRRRKFIRGGVTFVLSVFLFVTLFWSWEASVNGNEVFAEAGNDATTAQRINVNQEYTDNLSTANDIDWFKYTTAGKGKVSVTMTYPQQLDGKKVYDCYFYDHSGNAVDGDYYSIGGGTSTNTTTNVYRLPAGTYYIQIERYSSDVNTDYTITVQSVCQVDFNPGKGTTRVTSLVLQSGQRIGTLPGASLKGFSFTGWYTAARGGVKIVGSEAITADVTYYAHWKAKKYTVKFNTNGGKKLSKSKRNITVTYAGKYGKLAKPSRKGYKFVGWYTKKSGGTKITSKSKVKITKTTTLYAHWKKK